MASLHDLSAELFDAIAAHDANRLAALLWRAADPDVLQAERPGFRPLHAAVDELEEGGPIEALVLLLRHGAAVDGWCAARDATPLLMALFRGRAEAALLLLGAGADPNVVGGEGDSPLRWCVERGDRAMAATLLRCGAARTIDGAGGPTGMSALGRAASRLDVAMIALLLQAGADPDALDADRRAPRERLPRRDADHAEAWDAAAALLAGRARR